MTAPVSYRAAGPGDLPALAENVAQGFEGYRDFAPPGWEPPPARDETERIAERMALPRASAILAEVAGAPAGHALMIPAGGSRDPVDDLQLAHLMHRFVREPFCYTPADQLRARRFYECEGWTLERGPWLEDGLGLEAVEYRREL